MSTPLPNAWLADLAPYRVPRPSAPIDLRLDGNEGSTPDPELLRFLDDGGAELLRRYPDQTPLEHELAERLRVAPEQVLVTAGADDALERALAAYCEPGRRLVLPSPTFEMLERYARRTGCEVVRVPWPSGPWPLRSTTVWLSLPVPADPRPIFLPAASPAAKSAMCR